MSSGFNNVIHLRQTSTNAQRMLAIAIQLRHVQTRLGVLLVHAFKAMRETAFTVMVRNTLISYFCLISESVLNGLPITDLFQCQMP